MLTFNSAKPAFQEGKLKIQKLLTNTFFPPLSPAFYNMKCTDLQVVIVNEKSFPVSSIHFPTSHPTSDPLPPTRPLIRHLLLLPYSFCDVPHKPSQSTGCSVPWIRAELHLNTLKTASVRVISTGACSLAQAEVPILLAASAPPTATGEGGKGFCSC